MIPIPKTMKSPADRRNGIWRGGILQIWVTRACDKSCFACTQGSNLGGKPEMITVEQFREACRSLMTGPRPYFGVVGIFGGNPCVHPKFDELCRVMREEVPFEQRGLWSNHLRGKGAHARVTFNPKYSNLNVHQDRGAWDEFERDWPEAVPYRKGLDSDSCHTPPFVSMRDVGVPEDEMWDLIGKCDVNQHWSAMVGVFRGELRGWFCEIAGAQAMLHQNENDYLDTGVEVVPGWWDRPMSAFEAQVHKHCPDCGIPMRGEGVLANGGAAEMVSTTHQGVYTPKVRDRRVELVQVRADMPLSANRRSIDYLGKNTGGGA